jgi:hypothetical protein
MYRQADYRFINRSSAPPSDTPAGSFLFGLERKRRDETRRVTGFIMGLQLNHHSDEGD